jgi:hypothetical protein
MGNNRGHDAQRTLQFAERDAQKIYEVLRQLGGFEGSNIQLLLGSTAPQAWKRLQEMEQRLRAMKDRGLKALLLIFYSGHADGKSLEMGSTALNFSALKAHLRGSVADTRLAIIDSCQSGKLIKTKGGVRGASFKIQVTDAISSSGYAIITSSAADELSQESSEIRGSFFTHHLVSALRGSGDLAKDGKVTLAEAYEYAYRRTVAQTMATIGGGQHPMYEFKLAGHGEVILTQLRQRNASLLIRSPVPGRVVVINRTEDMVVAECEIKRNRPAPLALAPGGYWVYLVSSHDVRRSLVQIRQGQQTALAYASFRLHRLQKTIDKGGLFRRATIHQLAVGFLLRRVPLAGDFLSYGVAADYGLELPNGWRPTARLGWSAAPKEGISEGFNHLSLHLGLGYVWRKWMPFSFTPRLAVGYEHFFQAPRHDLTRSTPGFCYLGGIEAAYPLGGMSLQLSLGAGGRLFGLRQSEPGTEQSHLRVVHRLDLQLLLALGWSIEVL